MVVINDWDIRQGIIDLLLEHEDLTELVIPDIGNITLEHKDIYDAYCRAKQTTSFFIES